MHGYRFEHVVGFELERAAPERGLEDMSHMLASAVFAGLHQQSGPFERPQDAGRERGHLSPLKHFGGNLNRRILKGFWL